VTSHRNSVADADKTARRADAVKMPSATCEEKTPAGSTSSLQHPGVSSVLHSVDDKPLMTNRAGNWNCCPCSTFDLLACGTTGGGCLNA
jgi:hypothetical protein